MKTEEYQVKLDWHIGQLHRAQVELCNATEGLKFLHKNTGKDFPEFNDLAEQALASQLGVENVLVKAIIEVLRVLESDDEAIVDTLWTTQGNNETLWDHCVAALRLAGIEHKPQVQQLPAEPSTDLENLLEEYWNLAYQEGKTGDQSVRANYVLSQIKALKQRVPELARMRERESELVDLLRSARCIAERKGKDTAWERFSKNIEEQGIGAVTARVFKVLDSDKPAQPDIKKIILDAILGNSHPHDNYYLVFLNENEVNTVLAQSEAAIKKFGESNET